MPLLCLEFKNHGADMYMLDTVARLAGKKKGGGIKTPIQIFLGTGTKINNLWFLEIEPNLPRVYWGPLVIAVGLACVDMLYMNIPAWIVFGLLMFSLALYSFWTEAFYRVALRHFGKRALEEKIIMRNVQKDEAIKTLLGVVQNRTS